MYIYLYYNKIKNLPANLTWKELQLNKYNNWEGRLDTVNNREIILDCSASPRTKRNL
jgi:hypothetical protein